MPDALKAVPFPTMMLQTLVENAIKHGLEPKSGGGTIWVLAVAKEDIVAVTVADDGNGFGTEIIGSGIGLRNVRNGCILRRRRRGVESRPTSRRAWPRRSPSMTGPREIAMTRPVTCVVAEDDSYFATRCWPSCARSGRTCRSWRPATTAAPRWRPSAGTSPTLRSSTSACPD